MNIRKAVMADIPALCDLLSYLFEQEVEFVPDVVAQEQGLAAIIENEATGDILVADNNGQVIGMVNLLYTVSTALGGRVAILEDMVVKPKYRGQQIGDQLLGAVLALLKKNDCMRVTLLTDCDNTSAQHFYKRNQFEKSDMVVYRQLLSDQS